MSIFNIRQFGLIPLDDLSVNMAIKNGKVGQYAGLALNRLWTKVHLILMICRRCFLDKTLSPSFYNIFPSEDIRAEVMMSS